MSGFRLSAPLRVSQMGAAMTAAGGISATATPLDASAVPSPIQLAQGGSYDIADAVTGGTPPYTVTLASGTLPSGVTLSGTTLSATSGAALGLTSDLTFNIDDSADAPAAPGELPTFGITSAAGGSDLPFTFGHVFAQGDVPAGSYVDSDLADWQAVPTTYWPDGSIRHAIIAGRATCTTGVLKSVQLSAGSARSGTALTEADLASALPATTLVCGAETITLGTLVGTSAKHRTVCAGPVMSNWLYRKQLAGSNHLVAWFDVRIYKGGAVEIFPWIENGYLLVAGPTNDVRTYTLTIGGVQKFSQSLDIKHHTRIPLVTGTTHSYWSTDPQITPKHDTAYMMASKMLPNYGWALNGSVLANTVDYPTTYTPNWLGTTKASMGETGFGIHIGVLPQWQAGFLTSSADPRAYASVIVNALASGAWPIHYRDENTNEPIRLTDYPSASLDWGGSPTIPGGTGGVNQTGGTNAAPDRSHQPSMGFLPWLITGRWFHLDETLFWTTWNYLKGNQITREGAASIYFDGEVRARGWTLRTHGQALAIVPSDHPCFASLKASWEANMAAFQARYIAGSKDGGIWKNNLGCLGLYTGSGQSPYGTEGTHYWDAPWMQSIFSVAFGMAWDMDVPQSTASKAAHLSVRDFAYRHPVGMAGDGSDGNYNWRHFAAYMMPYGADAGALPLETWLADWGEVFAVYQDHAGPAWGATLTLDPTSGGEIYYANGSTYVIGESWAYSSGLSFPYIALVYAKDHGAVGADAAFARITSAPSYADAAAQFKGSAIWGLAPR